MNPRLDWLRERVGDLSQLGDIRRLRPVEGPEAGMDLVELFTPAGLWFEVIPGRGLNIGRATYLGVPLAFRTAAGDWAASFFEPEGLGWLRTFAGGLLVTCGLTYAGAPDVDRGQALGLHGRVSNIPARYVSLLSGARSDSGSQTGAAPGPDGVHVLEVRGTVREAHLFGPNVELRRVVRTYLDRPVIEIEDEVENLGYEPADHMIVYHFNFGFPLVDESARLVIPSTSVQPRDEAAARGVDRWNLLEPPQPGMAEQVFYHRLSAGADGFAHVVLANPKLAPGMGMAGLAAQEWPEAARGIGVRLSYDTSTLPILVQWKLCASGAYVLGLEPANCHVEGRSKERERGSLVVLAPGEVRRYRLRLEMFAGRRAVEQALQAVGAPRA